MSDEAPYHAVGACVLSVLGASQADLLKLSAASADLVVSETNGSRDCGSPALYDVQVMCTQ